jgi:hypothetical protein
VDLVDHEEPGRVGHLGQDVVPEARVVQPLGGDQQEVDVAGAGGRLDRLPVVDVLAVDGGGPHADALPHLGLVAHQGQERGDHQARPGPGVAQQAGGDEVHDALAPARALDDEDPLPAVDEGLDGLELAVPEPGVGTEELGQQLGRPVLGGHGATVRPGCDGSFPSGIRSDTMPGWLPIECCARRAAAPG